MISGTNVKYLKFFVGLIITIFSLFAVFRKINFSEIFQIISAVNIKYLVFSIACLFFSLLLKSVRWQLLLNFFARFNFRDVFVALAIGNMLNMLLPFRSGDLIRVFALSKKEEVLKTSIFGTVVYEHALDLLSLLFIFCITILTYSFPISRWIKMPIFSLSLGCALFFIFIFIFKEKIKKLEKWINNSENSSEKIYFKIFRHFFNYVLLNITLSYSWKEYLNIFGYTVVMWMFNGLWLYFLFLSLDFSSHYQFGIGEISILILSTSLAVMVPSAPSYVGTLHLSTLVVLRPTGLPQELIVSYAILQHAISTLLAIVTGFVSWISVLDLKEIGIVKFLKFKLRAREKVV